MKGRALQAEPVRPAPLPPQPHPTLASQRGCCAPRAASCCPNGNVKLGQHCRRPGAPQAACCIALLRLPPPSCSPVQLRSAVPPVMRSLFIARARAPRDLPPPVLVPYGAPLVRARSSPCFPLCCPAALATPPTSCQNFPASSVPSILLPFAFAVLVSLTPSACAPLCRDAM